MNERIRQLVEQAGGHFGEGDGLIFDAALTPFTPAEITNSSTSPSLSPNPNPSRFICSPNEKS